jgi:hypothetical protein
MPPIITAIFKFSLFITWHCPDGITLFAAISGTHPFYVRGIQMS